MRLSVIIPTLNEESHLSDQITAVRAQADVRFMEDVLIGRVRDRGAKRYRGVTAALADGRRRAADVAELDADGPRRGWSPLRSAGTVLPKRALITARRG
jgi:hypothetical protein